MLEANISGNLDAPEGGLDAVMQAIACEVIYFITTCMITKLNCKGRG